jgi:hypothetical protein
MAYMRFCTSQLAIYWGLPRKGQQQNKSLQTTSQTVLSGKLSPPARPSAPNPVSWILFIGLAVVSAFPMVVIGESGIALGIIGFTVVFVVLEKKGEKAKQQAYQQALQKWNHAIAIWNRLYYCARDDCVFEPTNGAYAPADRIYELLQG